MIIPSWLVIGIVTIAVIYALSQLSASERSWFNRLIRPKWLTFEWAIPFIWIFIFICGAWSAYLVWETNPYDNYTWFLMGFYLLLEIVIMSYTSLMCKMQSLTVGVMIGGFGFILGVILSILVFQLSTGAFILLLPYLLWSPIGTYVTWAMIPLNPGKA
jgi:tryptophan-rich sensory protein